MKGDGRVLCCALHAVWRRDVGSCRDEATLRRSRAVRLGAHEGVDGATNDCVAHDMATSEGM